MNTVQLFFALCLVFLFCAAVEGAVGCNAKDDPTPVDAETMTDFILDFDDLPVTAGTWFTDPYNVTLGSFVVTLYGPQCKVADFFGLGSPSTSWVGNQAWVDGVGQPGKFLGLGATDGAFCNIIFSEPISAFSLRAASFLTAEAGVFIYDEADQEINCRLFPYIAGNNGYSIRGFNTSTTNNIKKIVIKDLYSVVDILRGTFCSGEKSLINGKCQLPDPCIMDPYPCGTNTNCSNNSGQPICTCLAYHEGNPTTECTPVTCASADSPCSPQATCSEIASEPFIDCKCNDGFEGTGFGLGGCIAVAEPAASPASSNTPAATPASSNTPAAAPGRKVSASSIAEASVVSVVLSLGLAVFM